MGRQAGLPMPKNRREFAALLKRVESDVYRQVAESLTRGGMPMTLQERAEQLLIYANDREDSAHYALTYEGRDAPDSVDQMIVEAYPKKGVVP